MGEAGIINANGVAAFVARPEGTPKGALVICFEIFGLNGHMEDLCRRFARAGYIAAAPDFYHRLSEVTVIPYADRDAALALANTLTDQSVMADIDSVLEFLTLQPGIDTRRTGIVGYCLGGRLAFLTACRHPELKACVSFYGGGIARKARFEGLTAIPLEEAASIGSPMFLAFGGKDESIPAEDVQAIRDELARLKKRATIEVYPDAGHGFMCDERGSYNERAAMDGWAKTIAFLDEHMD